MSKSAIYTSRTRANSVLTPFYSTSTAGLVYPPTTKSMNFATTVKQVGCSTICDFERTDSFSISVWYKGGPGSPSNYNQCIIGKSLNNTPYTGWFVGIISTKLEFWVRNTFTSKDLTVNSTTAITDSVWRHLVCTYNGSSLASGALLYINGSSDTPIVVANTLGSNTIRNAVQVGIGWDLLAAYGGTILAGNLCECSVYNRVLTPAEVTEIYNAGKPMNLARLASASACINWWRLGTSDTYPTAIDQKLIQNGTMTGMTSADIVTDAP